MSLQLQEGTLDRQAIILFYPKNLENSPKSTSLVLGSAGRDLAALR